MAKEGAANLIFEIESWFESMWLEDQEEKPWEDLQRFFMGMRPVGPTLQMIKRLVNERIVAREGAGPNMEETWAYLQEWSKGTPALSDEWRELIEGRREQAAVQQMAEHKHDEYARPRLHTTKTTIHIPTYNGKRGKFGLWLEEFDDVCEEMGYSEPEKIALVRQSLKAEPHDQFTLEYREAKAAGNADWRAILEEMRLDYDGEKETSLWEQVTKIHQRPGEDIASYQSRFRALMCRLKKADTDLPAKMQLQSFLNGVSHKAELIKAKPTTIRDVVREASRLGLTKGVGKTREVVAPVAGDRQKKKKIKCYNCGTPGHIAKNCRKMKTCFACGGKDHISSDPKYPKYVAKSDQKEKKQLVEQKLAFPEAYTRKDALAIPVNTEKC